MGIWKSLQPSWAVKTAKARKDKAKGSMAFEKKFRVNTHTGQPAAFPKRRKKEITPPVIRRTPSAVSLELQRV
jgi:hypothetical protein